MNDDEDERTTQFSIYICPNEALRSLSSGKKHRFTKHSTLMWFEMKLCKMRLRTR